MWKHNGSKSLKKSGLVKSNNCIILEGLKVKLRCVLFS